MKFSTEAINSISKAYSISRDENHMDKMRKALNECLKKISKKNHELLQSRYENNFPLKVMAEKTGRSEGALKMSLVRIRQKLSHCIKSQMNLGKGENLG